MIAEQLQAARTTHWRQQHPLLTLEDAQSWLGQHPLCLYLPLRAKLPAPAPSFVEACLGKPQAMPAPDAIEQAQALLTRLTADGAVVALNLLGTPGEQPDFLATREALPYVLCLRADADWKHAPQKSSGHKISPLVLELWKLLELHGSLTAAEARAALGRELTEAAVLRALAELWQGLRITPVYSEQGQPARWAMMRVRQSAALATAAGTGQVTAISLLVSMYLQSVYAATSEEIEIFLSPITSRSRVREAVRGLAATRQIHSLSMDAQTYYFLENGLPEFATVAVSEVAEGAATPIAVRPKRREHPLAPAPAAEAASPVLPGPVRTERPAARSGWKSPQRGASDARQRRPQTTAVSSGRGQTAQRGGGERPPFPPRSGPPRDASAGGQRPWRAKTTADPSAPLRSGRDDKKRSSGGGERPAFKPRTGPPRGAAAGGERPWRPKTTADPSAPLRSGRDDKKRSSGGGERPAFKPRSGPPRSGSAGGPRPWRPKTTADPSAPLRSGQDDKKRSSGTGARPAFKPRSGPPHSGAAGGPRPWRPKTTADPSAPLRSGRDDKGRSSGGRGRPSFQPKSGPPRGGAAGGPRPWRPKTTADPSAPLRSGRDDKRVGDPGGRPPFKPRSGPPRGASAGGQRPWRPKTTADPSASLRSGRDDKGRSGKPGGFAREGAGSRPRPGGGGRPAFRPKAAHSGGKAGDYPRRKPERKKPGA